MKTREEVTRELFDLLDSPCGPDDEQIRHREGRVRSLAWVLTGTDVGYDCLRDPASVLDVLGWRYERRGDRIEFATP